MGVVEALLEGVETNGELNLDAALEALAGFRGESLVTIESDDETVRIWIDESSAMED